MIADGAEALEFVRRVTGLNAEIAQAEARLARTTAIKARRRAKLDGLRQARESLLLGASQELPLFDRPKPVPTPEGQPEGLVAGAQPGAILGCRANTLRPVESNDEHAGSDDDRYGTSVPVPADARSPMGEGEDVASVDEDDPRAAFVATLPEGLRPLMLDDDVSDEGEYLNPEIIEIPIPKSLRCKASILVARGADGRYRSGSRFTASDAPGKAKPPTIAAPGHVERLDALAQATREIAAGLKARGRDKAAQAVREWAVSLLPVAPSPKPRRARKAKA